MSSKWVTRSSEKKEYTCYDEYLCDSKERKDMCRNCVTYLDDPEKKKKMWGDYDIHAKNQRC